MAMQNGTTLRGDFNPDTGFGALGDDSKVLAKFYMRSMLDAIASQEAGRPIKRDVAHIQIIQPGESRLSVYDQPATNQDIERFYDKWQKFQRGLEQAPDGSPISLLFPESPAIQDNLKSLGFHTIEQLANAPDSGIQNIGMGGQQWREKAKTYLAQADKGKDYHGLSARVDAMDLKLREKDDRIAALEAALAEATTNRKSKRDAA